MAKEHINKVVSRRELIIGGAALLGGYALRSNLVDIQKRYLPHSPEAEAVQPVALLDGLVSVSKGAKIRTSPRFPQQTRLSHPDNTIKWEEIDSVNFTKLDRDFFVTYSAEIVEGQPASYEIWPDGVKTVRNIYWLRLLIGKKNKTGGFGYVNLYGSENFVQQLTNTEVVFPGYDTYSNLYISKLNNVILPSSKDRLARDSAPYVWARLVEQKLDGASALRGSSTYTFNDGYKVTDVGQQIVSISKVVASGDNLTEKIEMEQKGTLVNVRNHPGKEYLNGEPVEIVGKVKQQTEIRNVFVDGRKDWVGLRRKDILGDLYNDNNRVVKIEPGQVVAIWKFYLDL
ncbi:MAG TPA: hypothetical protein VIK81_00955 [Patescibacteria group bacterium]